MSVSREEVSPTVLIIEDELLLLWSLRLVFSRCGFRVVSTESVGKAIELLNSTDVSVILADSDLPQIENLQLLRDIRAISVDIPIIILGSDEDPELLITHEFSNIEYCEKPIDFNELVSLARKLGVINSQNPGMVK